MTASDAAGAADRAGAWRDPAYARAWARGDDLADLLALPRAIAAAVVEDDRPQPRVVVDVGSGPGEFLAVFLAAFPDARGIWVDVSEPMRELAGERLAAYADRVEYRIADMGALAGADLPGEVDVVTTSRASHHLDAAGLTAFYGQAAALLAPGGWLVNLDHVGTEPQWDRRLRSARTRFRRRSEREATGHRHPGPLPSLDDHRAALAAAGLADAHVAWQAFVTCLLLARKA